MRKLYLILILAFTGLCTYASTTRDGYSESSNRTQDTNSDETKQPNSKDEIVLTVTSDGATKDEAVKNALRSAIEQSYGAFVSANTTILNDELVKDEIITVTNGAIKEYSELSSVLLSNGRYNVTVTATVSLPHLITYAKNHGSECEFAGSNFGRDLKLFKIEQENELKILNNMLPVVKDICRNTMHWEMEIGEPFIPDVRVMYKGYKDEGRDSEIIQFYGSKPDLRVYLESGWGGDIEMECNPELREYLLDMVRNPSNYCCFEVKIYWMPNGDKIEFIDYVINTIKAIRLNQETYNANKHRRFGGTELMVAALGRSNGDYLLRNNDETIGNWYQDLKNMILESKQGFQIKDSSNQINEFYPHRLLSMDEDERETICSDENILYFHGSRSVDGPNPNLIYGGKGLFGPLIIGASSKPNPFVSGGLEVFLAALTDCEIGYNQVYTNVKDNVQPEEKGKASWTIFVYAPLSEISKYTSFKIEPKDN